MSERKAVIKNADMSEDMQQDAVDCASQALEKYNIEKASSFPYHSVRRVYLTGEVAKIVFFFAGLVVKLSKANGGNERWAGPQTGAGGLTQIQYE